MNKVKMSRAFLVFFILVVFLLKTTNAQNIDYHKVLTSGLQATAKPLVKGKGKIVFVYNRADCSSCNGVVTNVLEDKDLKKMFPPENRVVLLQKVRKVELEKYRQRFDFLSDQPAFISSDSIYHSFFDQLPEEKRYAGGFVFIDSNNRIIEVFSLKDPNVNKVLHRIKSCE